MSEPAPRAGAPPDLAPWRDGGTGVDYVHSHAGDRDGPHLLVTALVHGNEVCGAAALVRLLEEGVRPARGRLTLAFVNVAAYARVAPPVRCIHEDFNRLWSADVLDGPRESAERRRARELRPFVDAADMLLDLHSMSMDGPPLLMAGPCVKGARLALALGAPTDVVRDHGPAGGVRMRDYAGFADPDSPRNALLLECGRHDDPDAAQVALDAVRRLMDHLDMLPPGAPAPAPGAQRMIEVTHTVNAETAGFRFVRPFRSLETVLRAGTEIAADGDRCILTPYDRCLLVMPTRAVEPGQTAVRLARAVPRGAPIRPLPAAE